MRKLFTIIIYTIIVLIIGRNLTLLPIVNLGASQKDSIPLLKQEIQKIISKQKGNYSIYVTDLNSPVYFGINEKEIFTAASINKLPIVAVLYSLAEKGEVSLDETIIVQPEDIQDYGTGTLRYENPGGAYSLKTLAKLTLQKSDNTAAHLIAVKLTMDTIQQTIQSWGLTQTDMANNKTSLFDMALLLGKIYKGGLISQAYTQDMLSFLKDTDIEDRIPLLLPKDAVVFHKTGDAIGVMHDAGIVEKNGKAFFIGIFTSDIGDKESETKGTIAAIAKKTFDVIFQQ